MNYSRRNCDQPSSTEAKKNHRAHGDWIASVIESKMITEKERVIKESEKLDNQRWIIILIRMLEEEFKNEPTVFSLIEKDVLSQWGKYQRWRKFGSSSEETNCSIVYFRRTFSLVYTDFYHMSGIWAQDIIERTIKVVSTVYQRYEEITGNSINIVQKLCE